MVMDEGSTSQLAVIVVSLSVACSDRNGVVRVVVKSECSSGEDAIVGRSVVAYMEETVMVKLSTELSMEEFHSISPVVTL